MGQQESLPTSEPKELIAALTSLSTYEITRYAQHYKIDLSHPPSSFSPLHYMAARTSRRKVLSELMDLCGCDPLLTWNGDTLFKEACTSRKWPVVDMFLQRISVSNRHNEALVVKDIWRSFAFDDEDRRKVLKAWEYRIRNARRLVYLLAVHKYQAVRLPMSLAREVVHYI